MKRFHSIKKNEDFKKVYERKKAVSDSLLVLFIEKREEMESNRIGISVSKKVGNSVVRHTLARRLREIFRHVENEIGAFDNNINNEEAQNEQGMGRYDLVVVCREKAKDVDYKTLEKSFIKLCRKQGILKND